MDNMNTAAGNPVEDTLKELADARAHVTRLEGIIAGWQQKLGAVKLPRAKAKAKVKTGTKPTKPRKARRGMPTHAEAVSMLDAGADA